MGGYDKKRACVSAMGPHSVDQFNTSHASMEDATNLFVIGWFL